MNSKVSRRQLAGALGMGALALTGPPFPSLALQDKGAPKAPSPELLAGLKNVKDFGARGDGRTDDTAAIQAAVNCTTAPCSAANRGTIYFPPGTYAISAPIVFETAQCN